VSTSQYVIGNAILASAWLLKLSIIYWGRSSDWRASVGIALLFFIGGVVLWGSYGNWLPFVLGVMEIVSLFVSRARDARKAAAQ
jgi:hypothetical protein